MSNKERILRTSTNTETSYTSHENNSKDKRHQLLASTALATLIGGGLFFGAVKADKLEQEYRNGTTTETTQVHSADEIIEPAVLEMPPQKVTDYEQFIATQPVVELPPETYAKPPVESEPLAEFPPQRFEE